MLSLNNFICGFKNFRLNLKTQNTDSSLLFVIGPNGSGKSTFLKTLAGILPPQAGSFSFQNTRLETSAQNQTVYLPSSIHTQDGLRGYDVLELYECRAWENHPLLRKLEITDLLTKDILLVSAGERQRIFLAAVLLNPSPIAILDEPLNHLDWNFSLKIADIINLQRADGRMFIISNHNLSWSLRFSNTQTWVLFQNHLFVSDITERVLGSPLMTKVFNVRMGYADNPLDKTRVLVVSNHDEHI